MKKKPKVYCDTGGFRKELKDLEVSGSIELIYFPLENRNKKIKGISRPTGVTWEDLGNLKWSEANFAWDDTQVSDRFSDIERIVGKNNNKDIKHLDSAYKSGCAAFITSDKDDIGSKKQEIFSLLELRVFHYLEDWDEFIKHIKN